MIEHWQEMTDFHNKMQGQSLAGAPSLARVKEASKMCNALFMEVAELQDSFTWKLNRDRLREEEPKFDRHNVAREVVDCLFFLHHICEAAGVDALDLNAAFIEVMANNRRRHIDQNFSSDQEDAEERSVEEKLDTIINLLNGEKL